MERVEEIVGMACYVRKDERCDECATTGQWQEIEPSKQAAFSYKFTNKDKIYKATHGTN